MKRFLALWTAAALLLSAPALALEDIDKNEAARRAAASAVELCTDETMTDLEKLTALHDWLALNCDYGLAPDNETAYGALIRGEAVCRGYAEGMACLASAAGLDGAATYSEDMDHAWILATLEGERYFCDCTWDDGKYEKLGLIRHRFWLFDEESAWALLHYGWDSGEAVPGGDLEAAPWGAAVTRVIFSGDWAYYIDGDFRLMRCDRGTWAAEELRSFDERWPDLDPEDGKEPEIYSGLSLIGGRLYFNTPREILSVDLAGNDLRTELAPDLDGRLVYGTAVREGRLRYSLAAGPGDPDYEVLDAGVAARDAWGCPRLSLGERILSAVRALM